MFKNVAGQFLELYAFNSSTGAPTTGDAANLTAYRSIDGGTLTALGDTSATEISSTNAPGWYRFDLTQAETNGDSILFTGKSSTSNVVLVGTRVLTRPANFTALSITTGGGVAIQSGLKRNQSAPITFPILTASGVPVTGATVTVTYSQNGGASWTTLGTATEMGFGFYSITATSSAMNAQNIQFRMTSTGGSGTGADNALTVFTDV